MHSRFVENRKIKRSGLLHDFDTSQEDWVQRQWLCNAVNVETPGVRMTLSRFIGVVYHALPFLQNAHLLLLWLI
jgi:hypothetical protein